MFKLSTGKYVAPQPIENSLTNSGFIEQALVIGNQEKFCAALIVPSWENLRKRIDQKHPKYKDRDLIDLPWVQYKIQREVNKVNEKLPPWEKVKKFILLEEPFTIEKGELTPKMSIRRNVVKKNYHDQIHNIYNS